jgi:hypothetical protein
VPAPTPPPVAPVAAPTGLTDKPVQSQDDKDVLAVYALLNKNDIPGAQRLYATIRKRNPKYEGLADLNTQIETRASDIKKQQDAVKAAEATNARNAAALEEEKKRTAAAQKEAEDAKAEKAPIMSVAPGGAFIAPSAPATPLLRGQVERPEIEKAIQQWADAFAKLDVNALSQVRNLTEAEMNRWKNTFKGMATFKMNVSVMADPLVIGNDAVVDVQETAQYTRGKGQPLLSMNTTNIKYRLRKVGNQWRVIRPDEPMPKESSQ